MFPPGPMARRDPLSLCVTLLSQEVARGGDEHARARWHAWPGCIWFGKVLCAGAGRWQPWRAAQHGGPPSTRRPPCVLRTTRPACPPPPPPAWCALPHWQAGTRWGCRGGGGRQAGMGSVVGVGARGAGGRWGQSGRASEGCVPLRERRAPNEMRHRAPAGGGQRFSSPCYVSESASAGDEMGRRGVGWGGGHGRTTGTGKAGKVEG